MYDIGHYTVDTKFTHVVATQFYGDNISVKSLTTMLDRVESRTYELQLLQDLEKGTSMLIHDAGNIFTVRPGDMVLVNPDTGDICVLTHRDFRAMYKEEDQRE